MVIVFDLDDTLYEEAHYVASGFRRVAEHLELEFGLPRLQSIRLMEATLRTEGRGNVFDAALQSIGKNTKQNVRKCLSVYRMHLPDIQIHAAARRCLNRFRELSKYVVTDGNRETQARKIKALGIGHEFRRVLITHRFGLDKAKPSPYCFQRILQMEKTSPGKTVYVGDNPRKDFVGIKPLGFKTVRVLTGPYRAITVDLPYDADVSIDSLDDVTFDLLQKLLES